MAWLSILLMYTVRMFGFPQALSTTPSTVPVMISAGTKISIRDSGFEFQETSDSSIDQLVSSMSNLSVARLKQKKNAFGMSGLEKAYDALLEVVSYPLLYNDVIETLNIECPKGKSRRIV
jgi:transitional endoplasmic reticulum ATPase